MRYRLTRSPYKTIWLIPDDEKDWTIGDILLYNKDVFFPFHNNLNIPQVWRLWCELLVKQWSASKDLGHSDLNNSCTCIYICIYMYM